MEEITSSSSGLTDWQLKLSYWYVTNKLLLRKLTVVFLVIINCIFWGFNIYGLAYWGLTYRQINEQTTALLFSPNDSLAILEALAPQPLNLSEVRSYGSGNDYDLLAEVGNPNSGWLSEFEYAFIIEGKPAIYFKSFALPGRTKFLASISSQDQLATLQVRNVKWQKLADFEKIRSERDRFAVSEQEFLPPTREGNPAQAKFKISNESAFDFWDGNVLILLYGGSDVVAFGYLPLKQFKSGETRELEYNWTQSVGSIGSLEIIPEINYVASANIMSQ